MTTTAHIFLTTGSPLRVLLDEDQDANALAGDWQELRGTHETLPVTLLARGGQTQAAWVNPDQITMIRDDDATG